eukprot:g4605.t1
MPSPIVRTNPVPQRLSASGSTNDEIAISVGSEPPLSRQPVRPSSVDSTNRNNEHSSFSCWTTAADDLDAPEHCQLREVPRIVIAGLLVICYICVKVKGHLIIGDEQISPTVHWPSFAAMIFMLGASLYPKMPVPVLPPCFAFPAFLYTLLRKDQRMRVLVMFLMVVPILILSVTFTCLGIWFDNFRENRLFGATNAAALCFGGYFGWGTAILWRYLSTYGSGTTVAYVGTQTNKEWKENWLQYDELIHSITKCNLNKVPRTSSLAGVRDVYHVQKKDDNIDDDTIRDGSVETFDLLLLSETNYLASRMTQLFSRSAWTHVAVIIENPSKEVKDAYGIEDDSHLPIYDRERYFVFESVRPKVKLTSLRKWMLDIEENSPYKVIGYVKVHCDRAAVGRYMKGIQIDRDIIGRSQSRAHLLPEDVVISRRESGTYVERLDSSESDSEDEIKRNEINSPPSLSNNISGMVRLVTEKIVPGGSARKERRLRKEKRHSAVQKQFERYKNLDGNDEWEKQVNKWLLSHRNTKFVTDPTRMRNANYLWNTENDAIDDGSFFCSQLVADGLQHMHMLDRSRLASNYTPHDLSHEKSSTKLFLRLGTRIDSECMRLREAPRPAGSEMPFMIQGTA